MWARAVILAVILLAGSSGIAQLQPSTAGQHSVQPPQIQQLALAVQTLNGVTTFHIGERIPLTLTFTCPTSGQYDIAPWESERGQEFGYFEEFAVSPALGWTDPLREYFDGRFPMTGHGWPWQPFTPAKPVTVHLDLNQWVRFEQPGDYSVRITSRRVAPSGAGQPVEMSGVLRLHIVPATGAWQSETLTKILTNLKSPSVPVWVEAMADLRYLGIAGAIDALTEQLSNRNGNSDSQAELGLIALPVSLRDDAIASMNGRIKQPDFPISYYFMTTMEYLHVSPDLDGKTAREKIRPYAPTLWNAVYAAFPLKEPQARAATVQTLLQFGNNIQDPDVNAKIPALVPDSFLRLDANSQELDLDTQWEVLRSPSFGATLATLAANLRGPSEPGIHDELQSLVFRRWYELDPQAAHREIMAEIGVAVPSISSEELTFLPAEQLPQFEKVWTETYVHQLAGKRGTTGSLLVRFGTGASTEEMKDIFDATPLTKSCGYDVWALEYLVRFSPADAEPRLRAVAEMGDDCLIHLLQWQPADGPVPSLRDLAIAGLNSNNSGVVQTSADYLAIYAKPQDKAILLRRYDKWVGEWKGREELMDHIRHDTPRDEVGSMLLGIPLGHALIANQAWFTDPALLSHVVDNCVGQTVCWQLRNLAALAKPPYFVTPPVAFVTPPGLVSFGVAQYQSASIEQFEQKLLQFPSGSRFVTRPIPFANGDIKPLLNEVQAVFRQHGLTLEAITK
jgi:hypothetical protein